MTNFLEIIELTCVKLLIRNDLRPCDGFNKKGRRTQGRLQNPDQGAQKNSTWPDAPFGAWVQALLFLNTRTLRFRLVVFCKAVLDARNVNRIFAEAYSTPRIVFADLLANYHGDGTTPIAIE